MSVHLELQTMVKGLGWSLAHHECHWDNKQGGHVSTLIYTVDDDSRTYRVRFEVLLGPDLKDTAFPQRIVTFELHTGIYAEEWYGLWDELEVIANRLPIGHHHCGREFVLHPGRDRHDVPDLDEMLEILPYLFSSAKILHTALDNVRAGVVA